ncbi:hypothetical protein V6N13_088639 [Hibiscus sabdariffa]
MKNIHLRELASKVEKATKEATKMAYACLEVDLKRMQDNSILVFQVVCGPFDVSHVDFSFMSVQSMNFDIRNPCVPPWNTFTLETRSVIIPPFPEPNTPLSMAYTLDGGGGNADEGVEVNNNRV